MKIPAYSKSQWITGRTAYPYKMIVDPRTMKIVSTYTGGTYDGQVLQVANGNH